MLTIEQQKLLEELKIKIQNLKQLQARFFNPIIITYKELFNALNKEFELTDLEIIYSLYYNIPLEKHNCKVCGKHVSFSLKYKKFKSYCDNKCKAKDKDLINKRLNTFKEKYGSTGVMNIPEIKNKIIKTNLNKYGVSNYFASDEFKETRINNLNRVNINFRDKGYTSILKKCESVKLVPLFSKEEYLNNINSKYKRILKWKCLDCGEEFDGYYANGNLPICECKRTKHITQNELEKYIVSLLPKDTEIKRDNRSIIPPLELDIYIPDLKLAIEFNGDYWHRDQDGLTKNYHLNKTKLCEEKGIKLIHIFEYEWLTKQELIKQRLKNAIDKNQDRVFARKCEAKEIDNKLADNFILDNHLQGICHDSIRLGLFYKDEIVSVMTFGKPRFNKKYQYELLRFCSKYPVIGGASKLLKYFENKYNPKSLISYANRCWSSKLNNVYEKIGFKLIDESDPGYIYISKDKSLILSRYQCQKHKLKKLLGEDRFNNELSETDNMLNNGFYKLYDCGQLVFLKEYS